MPLDLKNIDEKTRGKAVNAQVTNMISYLADYDIHEMNVWSLTTHGPIQTCQQFIKSGRFKEEIDRLRSAANRLIKDPSDANLEQMNEASAFFIPPYNIPSYLKWSIQDRKRQEREEQEERDRWASRIQQRRIHK